MYSYSNNTVVIISVCSLELHSRTWVVNLVDVCYIIHVVSHDNKLSMSQNSNNLTSCCACTGCSQTR